MPNAFFDPPVLIKERQAISIDLTQTPWFYNDGGDPTYTASLPSGAAALTPAPTDPALALGYEYDVTGDLSVQTSSYGVETQLGFAGRDIYYEPMWATREAAAAFGITLVEPGQAIRLASPVSELSQFEYEYGVFAGHWSPYQNTGNALLTVVCTDLEHHDFPHIFASTDPVYPLVISVGRYWPGRGRIRLADLWVPRGSALYIPPMPLEFGAECYDLHNNRNSARACWGDIHRNSVKTHTLLQNTGGYFYWFWNANATVHTPLEGGE
ncbi:MAG: hypothetical protein KGL44_10300 [Sphingomonadales bacterium]|nr:hypothetical protein [Sphingomonadales bacterium]